MSETTQDVIQQAAQEIADLLTTEPTAIAEALAAVDLLRPTMAPGRWWRATGPDGSVWCESSSESEVRAAARPDDVIWRLWRGEVANWKAEVLS